MVQSERLSAVGKMASTIIHDIKNPMGTLRMYAQGDQEEDRDSESAGLADEMIRQVDRFVNMTQEILTSPAGVSEIHLETIVLEDVMEGALSFIEKGPRQTERQRRARFPVHRECHDGLEKMVRVFYNLAGNAPDAMKDGGTLTIRTEKLDGMIAIGFTDTGCGIPDEIRSRILEPFFTYGKRHGTGLGCPLSRRSSMTITAASKSSLS